MLCVLRDTEKLFLYLCGVYPVIKEVCISATDCKVWNTLLWSFVIVKLIISPFILPSFALVAHLKTKGLQAPVIHCELLARTFDQWSPAKRSLLKAMITSVRRLLHKKKTLQPMQWIANSECDIVVIGCQNSGSLRKCSNVWITQKRSTNNCTRD